MSFSLNEVEATAKKAARGAGYTWGLSEEAAKATRWLCRHNIDGCAVLAKRLEQFDGTSATLWAPAIDSKVWVAKSGTLCPLIAGASLSDYATTLDNTGLTLHQVAQPSLLFFFAAMTAQQRKTTVSLQWPGTFVVTDGERLSVSGCTELDVQGVVVKFGRVMGCVKSQITRVDPAPSTWLALNRFAHRTYAPATEQSRLAGAGSGLANND